MRTVEGILSTPVPIASIEWLACDLVSIPSQAGINAVEPILERMATWLTKRNLRPDYLLNQDGQKVALVSKLVGDQDGPVLCLNACLDTASFGHAESWSFSPLDGTIVANRLRGRGAADSKIGAAILAHVAACLNAHRQDIAGTTYLLFDADEHSGRFGGVHAFVQQASPVPLAAVLAYPGNDKLVVGARGFYRARIEVFGRAAHSGASTRQGVNAIDKLAMLIAMVGKTPLPGETESFPLAPAVTVTQVSGGTGFSQVPDKAMCKIDMRLTPSFHKVVARDWLHGLIAQLDANLPSPAPTIVEVDETWPAYVVAPDTQLVRSFRGAGRSAFNKSIPTEICGPSNIGNFLATYGIPTICGLGVSYENLHGADESADVTSISASYRSYLAGTLAFLSQSGG